MISEYTTHLIQALPTEILAAIPPKMELVLSGGAFNGSYMLGSLYYLKTLETMKKLRIVKISGSSIGSLLGLLYFTNQLDIFNELYEMSFTNITKQLNLSKLLQLKQILKERLPNNVDDILRRRTLYICYYNVTIGKKRVKHTYADVDELIDCIIRSCYLPFFIDYNVAYKDKYIDGMVPHFLNGHRGKRKVMYINIFTHDKINASLAIKNEHTNLHRVFTGITDIHLFFIKQHNTYMCSYIDHWNTYEYVVYWVSWIVEKVIVYMVYLTKDIYDLSLVRCILKEFVPCLLSTIIQY